MQVESQWPIAMIRSRPIVRRCFEDLLRWDEILMRVRSMEVRDTGVSTDNVRAPTLLFPDPWASGAI